MKLLAFLAAALLASPAATRLDLGVNPSAVRYYVPDGAFIDLMKSGSDWSGSPALNKWGYPSNPPGRVGTMLPMEDIQRNYTVTRTGGKATIWLNAARAAHTEATFTEDSIPFRQGGTTPPISAGYAGIMMGYTDPAAPVTSITVARAEFAPLLAQGQIIAPDYVAKWKPFTAGFRFMDWSKTNEQGNIAPDTPRSQLSDRTWDGPRGVPAEAMAEMGNATGRDIWVNIPHNATDAYIVSVFDALKSRLRPGIRVQVEYSNEVWNLQFSQSAYALAQAEAKWGKGTPRERWTGFRTGQIGILARPYGFKMVGGVQTVGPGQATGWWQGYSDSGALPTDMRGWIVTVYLAGTLTTGSAAAIDIVNRGDTDAAFDNLRNSSGLSVKGLEPALTAQCAIAKAHALECVAYEANLHLNAQYFADNAKAIAFFAKVEADPRAGIVMSEALDMFERVGGTSVMMFASWGHGQTIGGNFGLTQGVSDAGSPVFQMAQRRMVAAPVVEGPTLESLAAQLRSVADALAAMGAKR